MITTIFRKSISLAGLVILIATPLTAQPKAKEMKLNVVDHEVVVNVSQSKAWEVLASYVNAGDFHGGLQSSHCETPELETGVGAKRFCQIDNRVSVSETITEWNEGEYYVYEVVEWENFPLKKLYQTYGVKTNDNGETVIYSKLEYKLSNPIIGFLAGPKLRNASKQALVYYKDYMETGTKKRPNKELRKTYSHVL